MTKKEMAAQIADDLGLNRKETTQVIDKFMDLIKESIEKEVPVQLRGFGVFNIRESAPKNINPFGRGVIEIPASKRVKFTPSKNFKIG